MSNHPRSEANSTASSRVGEGLARALRESIDVSLVAERGSSNQAHSKSSVEHSKTRTDDQWLPRLSGAARERALRLAADLASSHSD